MPITGQVNDLSLSELIELFCNKRRTGRLTVTYAQGVAYFYLKPGLITHATFGDLSGTAAIDYALSLANGSFTFSANVEAEQKTIDRPWASVVLEGLRRLDEGIAPQKPFSQSESEESEERELRDHALRDREAEKNQVSVPTFGFLSSQYGESSVFTTNRWSSQTVIAAVVLILAIIGVPWGLYTHKKAVKLASQQAITQPSGATSTRSESSSTPTNPAEQSKTANAPNSKRTP